MNIAKYTLMDSKRESFLRNGLIKRTIRFDERNMSVFTELSVECDV